MSYSLNTLYVQVGISKQAVYQYSQRQQELDRKMEQLVLEADELRKDHPGCGVEKMYRTLQPDFIGRDRFIETMMQLGYRLKKNKNYRKTTIASKRYYPNLIKGLKINSPSTLWQSDITYIQVGDRFYYAVFILDVYTRKIVGYNVADHMRGTANVKALNMALIAHLAPKIHHSDRGSQYTYSSYIDLLIAHNCTISMGLTAQDNAYAERINRTIKEEYLYHWKPANYNQLKRHIKKAVNNYNNKRQHDNLGGLSPQEFENLWSHMSAKQRPEMTIFNNEMNV